MNSENILTASVTINRPIKEVWKLWNEPEHIARWNAPSADWINKKTENNLVEGGEFLYAMVKKDGSEKFDFKGTYTEIILHKSLSYTLDDGRKTTITFTGSEPVKLTEIFEPVAGLDLTMQQEFCQSVLNKFKAYVEQF